MINPNCHRCNRPGIIVGLCPVCASSTPGPAASHTEIVGQPAVDLFTMAKRCPSVQDGLALLAERGVYLARRVG